MENNLIGFKCLKCNKDFATKSHLNRHLKKKISCNRQIKCNRCLKEFNAISDLTRHLNKLIPCQLVKSENILLEELQAEKEKNQAEKEKSLQKLEYQKILLDSNMINKEIEMLSMSIELEKIKDIKNSQNSVSLNQIDINTVTDISKLYIENNRLREELVIKNFRIQYLENKYIKRRFRIQYNELYVIYIIQNTDLKQKNWYKIGKTANLTDRLSVYNTSCLHTVLYYKTCCDMETMDIVDKMIQKKLNSYRAQANREFFMGDLDMLINVIDNCIEYIQS